MNKKLSIVIPTLNRCEYLKHTLNLLLPQVERNKDEVELVVCCNASKDDTDTYIKGIKGYSDILFYFYFDDYVEVGQSLIRSVSKANGDYIVLWGDDDIPYPYLVDYLLSILKTNGNIGILHLNRLSGKDKKYAMSDLTVNDCVFSEELIESDLESFVQRHTLSLGFISSLVFKREIWEKGIPFYSLDFYGYEHLPIIIKGASKDTRCVYCNFPVEIQRKPYNRDFSAKWALYHFVGVPRMMKDFDENGITCDAFRNWENEYNSSFLHFLWNLMYTSLDRKMYKPRCKEINAFQHSWTRKVLTYVVVYSFPKSVFVFLKKILYSR